MATLLVPCAGAHRDMVRGVRWLGASARVASFSSERTPHGFRNTLLLTDARSRASLPFRDVGVEAAPMLGIRAAPSGRYLLLLLRSAPSEIWAVRARPTPPLARPPAPETGGWQALAAACLLGSSQLLHHLSVAFCNRCACGNGKSNSPQRISAGMHPQAVPRQVYIRSACCCCVAIGKRLTTLPPSRACDTLVQGPLHACAQVGGEARPARIRVLDLPFTAVEWVLPREAAPREPAGAERWLMLERSPLARERSFFTAWDLDGGDAQAEGAPTRTPPHQAPAPGSGACRQLDLLPAYMLVRHLTWLALAEEVAWKPACDAGLLLGIALQALTLHVSSAGPMPKPGRHPSMLALEMV